MMTTVTANLYTCDVCAAEVLTTEGLPSPWIQLSNPETGELYDFCEFCNPFGAATPGSALRNGGLAKRILTFFRDEPLSAVEIREALGWDRDETPRVRKQLSRMVARGELMQPNRGEFFPVR